MLGGYRAGGKGVCGRLMSPAHETQSMREIRLLCGRLPRKGGGLTGMVNYEHSLTLLINYWTVHVYAVIHFCNWIVCGLFERKPICAGILLFIYICIVVGDPIIKNGKVRNTYKICIKSPEKDLFVLYIYKHLSDNHTIYLHWEILNNLIWCEYCSLIGWSAWSNIDYTWYCKPGLVLWQQIQIAPWNNHN